MEVAGSCLALAGATVSVSLAITKLITEMAELKEDLGLVHTELESVEGILFLIADNVHRVTCDGAMVSKSLSTRLDTVMSSSQIAVQQTSDLVTKYAGGGLRLGIGWIVAGKRELDKMRELLKARRMDLDVCLTMLNMSLASGIRIGTTQLLEQQAVIHDDVHGIMEGIQALQADRTKMEELVELLRSMATHRTDNFLMDRFIDSLTSYAETVQDRSVIGYGEHQEAAVHILPDLSEQTTRRLDSAYGSDSGATLTSSVVDGNVPSADTHSVAARSEIKACSGSDSALHNTPWQSSTTERPGSLLRGGEGQNQSGNHYNIKIASSHESLPDRNLQISLSLADAVRAGDQARVESLLGHGAHPDAHNPGSLPVLFDAIVAGDTGIIKLLCRSGADVNKVYRILRRDGLPKSAVETTTSPLIEAIRCAPSRPLQSAFALVRTLIEGDADPNGRHNRQKESPHAAGEDDGARAASRGRDASIAPTSTASEPPPPLLQCIITAHTAATDAPTRTAAAAAGRTMSHIALLLIRRGADPNARRGDGVEDHPLVMSLRYRNPVMLGVLTSQGSRLPVLTKEIGRHDVLVTAGSPPGKDSSEPAPGAPRASCESYGTITDLVLATVLADGRKAKQTWLVELIAQQPRLGTWCLLDAISSISSYSSSSPSFSPSSSAPAPVSSTSPATTDIGSSVAKQEQQQQQKQRLANNVEFLLNVLVDAGAPAQCNADSVRYMAKRSWAGAILFGGSKNRKSPIPASQRTAVLTPLELLEDIWLDKNAAVGVAVVSRSVLRDVLLGRSEDGQAGDGVKKAAGAAEPRTLATRGSRFFLQHSKGGKGSTSSASFTSNTGSRGRGEDAVLEDQPAKAP